MYQKFREIGYIPLDNQIKAGSPLVKDDPDHDGGIIDGLLSHWSKIGGDLSERPKISLEHIDDVVLNNFHSLGHVEILDIEINFVQGAGLEALFFASFRKFGQTFVSSRLFHFNQFGTFPGLFGNLGVFFLFGRHLGLKKIS